MNAAEPRDLRRRFLLGASLLYGLVCFGLFVFEKQKVQSLETSRAHEQQEHGRQLAGLNAEITDLRRKLEKSVTLPLEARHDGASQNAGSSPAAAATATNSQAPPAAAKQAVRRVGLVKKFLTMNPEESERLQQYFDSHGGSGMPDVLATGIEEVLGKEQADFYRDRVRDAFTHAEGEENEKEVIFLARKLELSDAQEQALRDAYSEAAQIDGGGVEGVAPKRDRAGLQAYLSSLRKRRELVSQRAKEVLTAEQYRAYLEYQAASAEQDLELWHGEAGADSNKEN